MAVWLSVSLGFAAKSGLLLITAHHVYIANAFIFTFYFVHFFFTLFM